MGIYLPFCQVAAQCCGILLQKSAHGWISTLAMYSVSHPVPRLSICGVEQGAFSLKEGCSPWPSLHKVTFATLCSPCPNGHGAPWPFAADS